MTKASFLEYVLEQLEGAKGLKARAMFGGHALYMEQGIFGIVHKGGVYFRTDDASRPAYLKAGSRPFNPKGKIELHRYYEVPAEVLDDSEELLAWAKIAAKT